MAGKTGLELMHAPDICMNRYKVSVQKGSLEEMDNPYIQVSKKVFFFFIFMTFYFEHIPKLPFKKFQNF